MGASQRSVARSAHPLLTSVSSAFYSVISRGQAGAMVASIPGVATVVRVREIGRLRVSFRARTPGIIPAPRRSAGVRTLRLPTRASASSGRSPRPPISTEVTNATYARARTLRRDAIVHRRVQLLSPDVSGCGEALPRKGRDACGSRAHRPDARLRTDLRHECGFHDPSFGSASRHVPRVRRGLSGLRRIM